MYLTRKHLSRRTVLKGAGATFALPLLDAMGQGPEDAVTRRPLQAYETEYGDSSTFTYGALRSMMIAYVPD